MGNRTFSLPLDLKTETPENIEAKIGVNDYVMDPFWCFLVFYARSAALRWLGPRATFWVGPPPRATFSNNPLPRDGGPGMSPLGKF